MMHSMRASASDIAASTRIGVRELAAILSEKDLYEGPRGGKEEDEEDAGDGWHVVAVPPSSRPSLPSLLDTDVQMLIRVHNATVQEFEDVAASYTLTPTGRKVLRNACDKLRQRQAAAVPDMWCFETMWRDTRSLFYSIHKHGTKAPPCCLQ